MEQATLPAQATDDEQSAQQDGRAQGRSFGSDRFDRGDRGDRFDRGDRGGPPRPESFEQMLRKFKKSVDNAGILKEVRARSFFESKSQKARRKEAKAARRRTRNKIKMGE